MRIPLNLQLLEPFAVLARVKNFTRAAAELHLTQPALSRAIQKLESQLGQPLFERRPREVLLTDLGHTLYERAREILKMVDNTFLELSEAGRRGRVRLGVIPTIAPFLLPTLLDSFARKHPHISVIVHEETTAELIKACTQGDVDLALAVLPIPARQLEAETLFSEDLFLVLPKGHPLARFKKVPIAAVEAYPFVSLNEAHCLSENIASFCNRRSVQPVSVERTSQLATVLELVALGHGVSIVPAMARRLDQGSKRVYRTFEGEQPTRTVAVFWNPARFHSAAVTNLREHLRTDTGTVDRRAFADRT